ncbi:hypothetical protein DRB17_18600 [Ferruginivarius sediminum]|uniref:Uncharacterized protein n=1 Tax=Ferruginivarius sediminum TaxID=2661937 RepID=A0A369T4W1_9PROT|nr:hypothetical protein DRB17_18600 [Ferruginivarius sediminum]
MLFVSAKHHIDHQDTLAILIKVRRYVNRYDTDIVKTLSNDAFNGFAHLSVICVCHVALPALREM